MSSGANPGTGPLDRNRSKRSRPPFSPRSIVTCLRLQAHCLATFQQMASPLQQGPLPTASDGRTGASSSRNWSTTRTSGTTDDAVHGDRDPTGGSGQPAAHRPCWSSSQRFDPTRQANSQQRNVELGMKQVAAHTRSRREPIALLRSSRTDRPQPMSLDIPDAPTFFRLSCGSWRSQRSVHHLLASPQRSRRIADRGRGPGTE